MLGSASPLILVAVGQTIDSPCSVCELEQKHVVKTVTKQGAITQVACEVCETVTNLSRGVKTSMSTGSSKNAAPYDRTRTYKIGTFGTSDTVLVLSDGRLVSRGSPSEALSEQVMADVFRISAYRAEYQREAVIVPWAEI